MIGGVGCCVRVHGVVVMCVCANGVGDISGGVVSGSAVDVCVRCIYGVGVGVVVVVCVVVCGILLCCCYCSRCH